MYSYTVLWVVIDSATRLVFKCLRKTPSVPADVLYCGW